ncbi:response regulator [Pseudodesulfovibrio cashew]|uniref:Response regulator n=2 Tax=Pseudodesulfovibrio cashew TaxID=2678688 RepID=A0A6I6JIB0_9BACT|nr:response regulator [Pseudodesulfovibrio cashew]
MIGQLLKLMAIKEGHQCEAVFSVAEGLEFLQREPVDIIFLDVLLPEGNGINSIPPILNSAPETDIVMLTGESSTQYIEKAFKAGATDYLIKPVNLERFSKVVGSLIKLKRKNNVQRQISREEIIGDSAKIKQCIEKVAQSSLGDANVLIQGETGTGKELFAKAIHANSGRAKNKYIIVDCTNLPVNLAESLLFGHDRGSFTGAEKAKKGLFELAHNGTIFLDEIGDLDLAIQKSLLRVLQEKKFRPLSTAYEVESDFRLVAATNRDLQAMVHQGTFRKDLYFRLQAFVISLPPLREREGDIERLVDHYLGIICEEKEMRPLEVGEDFMSALKAYEWPGNVRELVNVLQISVHKAMFDDRLTFYHLPQQLRMSKVVQDAEIRSPEPHVTPSGYNLTLPVHDGDGTLPKLKEVRKKTIDAMEQSYLHQLVMLSDNSAKTACKMSGLSRARLYELLNKHNLSLRGN